MKIKILSRFGYQTYPLTEDMVEISQKDLEAVSRREKCFNKAKNGVMKYKAPKADASQQEAAYQAAVIAKIRKQYSIDDEIALLRQKDAKPEAYQAYDAYCQQCKQEAKAETSNLTSPEPSPFLNLFNNQ